MPCDEDALVDMIPIQEAADLIPHRSECILESAVNHSVVESRNVLMRKKRRACVVLLGERELCSTHRGICQPVLNSRRPSERNHHHVTVNGAEDLGVGSLVLHELTGVQAKLACNPLNLGTVLICQPRQH